MVPLASSSSRILTHHQSASNVVHASGACHIAFLLSLLGLDQCLASRTAPVKAGTPWLIAKVQAHEPVCILTNPGDLWLADPIMGDDRGAGRCPKPSAQATYTTRVRLLRILHAIASAVAKTEVFNTLALNIEAIDRY